MASCETVGLLPIVWILFQISIQRSRETSRDRHHLFQGLIEVSCVAVMRALISSNHGRSTISDTTTIRELVLITNGVAFFIFLWLLTLVCKFCIREEICLRVAR